MLTRAREENATWVSVEPARRAAGKTHSRKLRIALVCPMISKSAMGLASYVEDLVPRLLDCGHDVTVLGTDCGYRGAASGESLSFDPRARVVIFPVRGTLNRKFYRSPELAKWMREHAPEFDVVDMQGLWFWTLASVARVCMKADIPYVVTPHGMMTRWDWQKRPVLKQIFFHALLKRMWHGAASVRFLSAGEKAASQVNVASTFEVIANAITAPAPANRSVFARQRFGISEGAKLILFLGRVTEQKGVLEIIDAFDLASRVESEAVLVIAGPSDGKYGEDVIRKIATVSSRDRIRVVGAVFGSEKEDLIQAASVFITLSRNEGLPLAALEALARGIPAVLTADSNLPELEAAGAGKITRLDPARASRDLLELLEDEDRLREMSRNARNLVDRSFSWNAILPRLIAMYEEAVGVEGKRVE